MRRFGIALASALMAGSAWAAPPGAPRGTAWQTEHQIRVECSLEQKVLNTGLSYRMSRASLVTASDVEQFTIQAFKGGYVERHPISNEALEFWAGAAATFGSGVALSQMPVLLARTPDRIAECFQEAFSGVLTTYKMPDGSTLVAVPSGSSLIEWGRAAPAGLELSPR